MAGVYLRKYGVSTTIDFELYKLDGSGLKVDAVSATGDVTLNRDEAGVETLDADAFTDRGSSYSLVISQAEMTAARIIVHIVDQGTQVWLDKVLIVETYGHASAQHPFDLGTATQSVNIASTSDIDFSATQKTSLDTIGDTVITNSTIHTDVGTAITDIGTLQTMLTDIHGTDLPAVKTDTAAIKAITDLLTLAAINAEVDTALNTAIPAINTANSVNDVLLDTLKKIGINKWAIVGTQLIIYDDDKSTPLYTFDLDSATAPTSRTPV